MCFRLRLLNKIIDTNIADRPNSFENYNFLIIVLFFWQGLCGHKLLLAILTFSYFEKYCAVYFEVRKRLFGLIPLVDLVHYREDDE